MKKGIKQSTRLDEIKSNSVGNTENDKIRVKAIGLLSNVKDQEAVKLQKGYKYMSKGKTSVLVAPDRFNVYFNDGYKLN